MNRELESQLKYCTDLPSLPGIAVQIIELCQQGEVELGSLSALITQDPALAAKILRVAISPLYARRRKCNNLRQAVALLGLRATQSLALSFSLHHSFSGSGNNGMDYTLYWRRSVLAALSARALAIRFGSSQVEEHFLAALLQDIGMLALDKAIPEIYSKVAVVQHDHLQLQAAEQRQLETDHAEVGAWLLRSWNMPMQFQSAVAGSHDPSLAGSDGIYHDFIRNVYVSGYLADVWMHDDRDLAMHRSAQAALEWLGMDNDAFLAIVADIGKELPEMESLFEVDLIDDSQIQNIIERGRELLLIHNLQAMQQGVDIQHEIKSLQSQARTLEEENRRDNLTGLYNRNHLDRVLSEEFTQATNHNWPLSVAFIDLDHFKGINDTHGHQAGDRVLLQVARTMMEIARDTDVIARYGGEEFVLVLAGCNTANALRVCERIVRSIAGKPHDLGDGQAISVTVSIGIATHHEIAEFDCPEDLLRSADRALYTAKIQGRNCVAIYDSSVGSQVVQ